MGVGNGGVALAALPKADVPQVQDAGDDPKEILGAEKGQERGREWGSWQGHEAGPGSSRLQPSQIPGFTPRPGTCLACTSDVKGCKRGTAEEGKLLPQSPAENMFLGGSNVLLTTPRGPQGQVLALHSGNHI